MAKQELNQDEFVDLYEVLNLPQNADEEKIRKSINALYLESQQNLDHRNPKKRLHYQQLYEIFLPQARHLLLDGERRAEYDRYLTAFQTGTKVQTTTEEAEHKFQTTRQVTVTERLKEEEGVDPEKLAEQREDMWAQWKHGLEQVTEDAASEEKPAAPKPPAAKPAKVATSQPTRAPDLRQPAMPGESEPQPQGPRGFSDAALHAGESRRLTQDAKRQQDQQKAKIIERVAQNAMMTQAAIMGAIALGVSCVVLYFATNYLTSSGILTGTFGQIVNLGWIPVALIIAFVQGRNAGENARQSAITRLSRLSFEELKKRY